MRIVSVFLLSIITCTFLRSEDVLPVVGVISLDAEGIMTVLIPSCAIRNVFTCPELDEIWYRAKPDSIRLSTIVGSKLINHVRIFTISGNGNGNVSDILLANTLAGELETWSCFPLQGEYKSLITASLYKENTDNYNTAIGDKIVEVTIQLYQSTDEPSTLVRVIGIIN